MSSNSTTLFTGSSRYASDFQSLLDRAVAIASLNLTQLTSQKTVLQNQSSALSTLNTKFTALASALSELNSAAGASNLSYSVSDATIVNAALGEDAMEGAWNIEVTDLGACTSTLSKSALSAVTDPETENISSATSFTLTINGQETTIEPEDDTLIALVEAINDADVDVQASIVNVGTNDEPDYRLTIQSTKFAADTIQLNDGTQDLMDTLATGSNVAYKVNGMATELTNDTRSVLLAPGLTVTLLKESDAGKATTITVSRSTAAIGNALTSLVTAYNDAVDALEKHTGKNGGALAGQSIITALWSALRDIANYDAGSGDLQTLTDLGFEFDDDGKLSFNSSTFATATEDNFDALLAFLGSASESGFLAWADDVIEGLTDDTGGVLDTTIDSISDQLSAQDELIKVQQDRIDLIQENLTAQMMAADALIAALEQQALYFTNLFNAMRTASEMYS
jgi:flagellar hook-associated protein 2